MLSKIAYSGLTAAIALFLSHTSEAVVTLSFQQVGNNVVAQWSGSYDLPAGAPTGTNPSSYSVLNGLSRGFGLVGGQAGTFSGTAGTPGGSGATLIGQYSGDVFGFDGTQLFWPVGVSGVFSPTGTMTFTNTTLAAAGVDSYSNTLAFTGNANVGGSQEIRFTTIPEPSAALLMGLGATLCLFARGRRM